MKTDGKIARRTKGRVANEGYRERSRNKAGSFTRNRKMPFENLIYFVLSNPKQSAQVALDRYFREMGGPESMSQQAFSKARNNLNYTALSELFELSVTVTYEEKCKTWHGYRVMAIDGSYITLPNDKKLLAEFGGIGAGCKSPAAQGSIMYDVLNNVVADAVIEPVGTSERVLAKRHIDQLKVIGKRKKELVIMDRGYPSRELIAYLAKAKVQFLFRTPRNFSKEVDAIQEEGVVELEGVRCFVYKFTLSSGEQETLLTSLSGFTASELEEIYRLRWSIETKYDEVKNKLELENFTGRSANTIRQDFYASMYLANLSAAIAKSAQEEIDQQREGKNNKYAYKPNISRLIGTLKDYLILALLAPDDATTFEMLDEISEMLTRAVVPIRPDRTAPRPSNRRKAKFHYNSKHNA